MIPLSGITPITPKMFYNKEKKREQKEKIMKETKRTKRKEQSQMFVKKKRDQINM